MIQYRMILLIVWLLVSVGGLIAEVIPIDPTTSLVTWTGSKIGGRHTGHVPIEAGTIHRENGRWQGGTITLNMTQISTTDLSGKWQKKLVAHLKSDDFFSVDDYPTARFHITSIHSTNNRQFRVSGNLTIKHLTHPEAMMMTVTNFDPFQANGTLTFDRTDYDIRYKSNRFFKHLGNKLIHDHVDIETIIREKTRVKPVR